MEARLIVDFALILSDKLLINFRNAEKDTFIDSKDPPVAKIRTPSITHLKFDTHMEDRE